MTYGLIGKSLVHSYSKLIHEKLGFYEYQLFSLDEDQFHDFISARKFKGLNITIPYKEKVIPYCDKLTPAAKKIGAVNTLYFRDNMLWGHNTDYDGFLYMANKAGISFKDKIVLILGTGGTSKTAFAAVKDSGAKEILLASRKPGNGHISYNSTDLMHRAQIIVNTTPVGTYPHNGSSIIDLKGFPHCCGVIDVIYNPLRTRLLLSAREMRLPYSCGLPMLVGQATASAEHFVEGEKFRYLNDRITADLEASIKNIVLIGMPGCGKTTLGKALAATLGKTFLDTDRVIETQHGKTISEIFAEKGEAYFRKLEAKTAARIGKEHSQVIATGGGIILDSENMAALSEQGTLVFLERSLKELETKNRPLSKDLPALKEMYRLRLPLYEKYCDLKVNCNSTTKENIQRILLALKNG